MPTLTHRCARCGGTAQQSFGERVVGTELRWYESWWCYGCNDGLEADGADRLPEELRAVVISTEGAFSVHVRPKSKIGVVRVLRDAFGMSLHDATTVYNLLSNPFRIGLTCAEATATANAFPADVAAVELVAERSGNQRG